MNRLLRKVFLIWCSAQKKSAFIFRGKANLASQNTRKKTSKETQRKNSAMFSQVLKAGTLLLGHI